MRSLSFRMAQKSVEAALSALEIYNKPICGYREESFAILMTNAYETLFKAKIISDNKEKINSIYQYENKFRKNGKRSKRLTIKRSRLNNPITISLQNCSTRLLDKNHITKNISNNIEILVEVRNNSIHLFSENELLRQKIYLICAASIKNFVTLVNDWFPSIGIEKYNFFVTPLNFSTLPTQKELARLTDAQKLFSDYIDIMSSTQDKNDRFDAVTKIEVKFVKSSGDDTILVRRAKEGKPLNIEFSEEKIKEIYPYTYKQIVNKIIEKRPDIKRDAYFNMVMKRLKEKEKCCKNRYLNPDNPKSSCQTFYSNDYIDLFIEEYGK